MNLRLMALGAGLVIVFGLIAAYAAIAFGLVPANSDAKPSGLADRRDDPLMLV